MQPESMRQRAVKILRGEFPSRLPLITRLETWYTAHSRTGSLPERFAGKTLAEVHQMTGVGRLKFSNAWGYQLKSVEVTVSFNGERVFRQFEPVVENFPGMWDFVPTDRAGITRTELITPAGKLTLSHQLLEENVRTGTDPYLKEHLIKWDDDFRTVEYILEHAQFVPLFSKINEQVEEVGEHGMVVPLMQRIPFQQALLEYLGEVGLFFTLHDEPTRVRRLLALLDEQLLEALEQLAGLDMPYVEFPDNLDGKMTNPRLFREFCLPAYQKYLAILHAQGKKIGSHTDGNIQALLRLLAEAGLDVCESFSPYPLTPCKFQEAQAAWGAHPLIWGGIPSPILEEITDETIFSTYIDELFGSIRAPVILGVVDLFMRHNSIDRLETIARKVEAFDWQAVPGREL